MRSLAHPERTQSLVPDATYPGISTTWFPDPIGGTLVVVTVAQAFDRPVDALIDPPAVQPVAEDESTARRRELGAFLRSRRERIGPEQVGLPEAGRRRTPGLRREEIAQVANVGVTWYTWLEQGRDINVSLQVLDALARGLRLDPVEHGHLLRLAGYPFDQTSEPCDVVPESVYRVLDQLDPAPASLQNRRCDLLAYNTTYGLLFPELADMPVENRNTLWLIFTHPAWRASLIDRDETLPRLVAQFRNEFAENPHDPAWTYLVHRLQKSSPEFCELWERHDVARPSRGSKRVLHPEVGLLRFDFVNFWLCQRLGHRLLTYLPADDDTRDRIERLHVSAGGARKAQ
jgi:transcriptional regulator with XRE-family HTH domain